MSVLNNGSFRITAWRGLWEPRPGMVKSAALCASATVSGHAGQNITINTIIKACSIFANGPIKQLTVKSQNAQQVFCYD